MASAITLGELASAHLPAPVPYAVLAPEAAESLPLCLLLLGGGGTRDNLADLQPVFDGWWSEKSVPKMIVAVPSPGLDYYLEEPGGPLRWDAFLTRDFLPHIRSIANAGTVTAVAGISAGGYGALKLAFAEPHGFAAVAASQPMLEPGVHESDVGARNRLHRAAANPPSGALWESNNPANRVHANAEAIRQSGMVIYLEAGDCDFLNAYDGAEYLHRVLWDLDLSHEYHLVRGADHGGPSMRPRLRAMFGWLGAVLNPAIPDAAVEQAAKVWLESGMQGKPPAGATTTQAFIDAMHARFEPLRAQAAEEDPSTWRRLGNL